MIGFQAERETGAIQGAESVQKEKRQERSVFPLGTFVDSQFLRTEETVRSSGLSSWITQAREFHHLLLS